MESTAGQDSGMAVAAGDPIGVRVSRPSRRDFAGDAVAPYPPRGSLAVTSSAQGCGPMVEMAATR